MWVERQMQLFLLRKAEDDVAVTLGAAPLKRDPDLTRRLFASKEDLLYATWQV